VFNQINLIKWKAITFQIKTVVGVTANVEEEIEAEVEEEATKIMILTIEAVPKKLINKTKLETIRNMKETKKKKELIKMKKE